MKPIHPSFRHVFCSLSAILTLFFLLSSCGRATGNTDILPYQSEEFTATIRGELFGTAFEGELIHTVSPDPSAADSHTFIFSAPEALSGITVNTQAQTTTLSLYSIRINDIGRENLAWTKIAQCFTLQGEPLSVTSNRDKNEMTVIRQATDGTVYTVILDSEAGHPRWIEGDGIWIEILSFT